MKFLIVRLSSLGDVVHTLPLIHGLREAYPDAQIDWLVGKKGFELLSLIPKINNVYLLNPDSVFKIQKQKYDFVIDAQGLFKSALLSKIAFGKKNIGFKNTREFADIFYDEKVNVGSLFNTKRHIVDLNLNLISSLVNEQHKEVKFLIPNIKNPENANLKTGKNKRSIVIFPATTWESKLWSLDYWYELIEKISSSFNIFICASKNENQLISKLINKLDDNKVPYTNLIGKTNIKDLIYLLQNVDLAVGLDSFGLHLASAIKNDYGTPEVIGIYGPTSLYRNGPYGGQGLETSPTKNCLFLSELECIACRKKKCPLGHHKCMNDILPEYVLDKIHSVLKVSLA